MGQTGRKAHMTLPSADRPTASGQTARSPAVNATVYTTTSRPGIWNFGPGLSSTNRYQGTRRDCLGTRNTRSIHRGFGHLQQCSRPPLSTLGGGGNRTRVLQYLTRASPGAACFAFLSPGDHASKTPTGSVAVRCPAWPRDRVGRWILLADARHRVEGVPGLTTS